MTFVLDSSVALSWCFEDEQTHATRSLLERVVAAGAVAPSLWPLEVLNGLMMAERRKRLDGERRERLAGFLRALPISLDEETAAQAWGVVAQLAARLRLTVYDATYLELAQRLAMPLATLDKELRAAASAVGIPVLGLAADQ